MAAGRRFPTGVRELCVDSCSSATTCELERPNRGAFVCREAYFLCMALANSKKSCGEVEQRTLEPQEPLYGRVASRVVSPPLWNACSA